MDFRIGERNFFERQVLFPQSFSLFSSAEMPFLPESHNFFIKICMESHNFFGEICMESHDFFIKNMYGISQFFVIVYQL